MLASARTHRHTASDTFLWRCRGLDKLEATLHESFEVPPGACRRASPVELAGCRFTLLHESSDGSITYSCSHQGTMWGASDTSSLHMRWLIPVC